MMISGAILPNELLAPDVMKKQAAAEAARAPASIARNGMSQPTFKSQTTYNLI